MFIETEATPNPATLKFLPGRDVLGNRGTADFITAAEAAGRSPLAERVFLVGDVARVFLGADFVTVTKADDADWTMLRPRILGAIMEHFLSGMPVMEDGEADGEHGADFDPADEEIVAQIKQRKMDRARNLLRLSGLRQIEIGYEELQKDPSVFSGLCRFLSIQTDGTMPVSKFQKVRRDSQINVLKNYGEVRQVLDGTRYLVYLE